MKSTFLRRILFCLLATGAITGSALSGAFAQTPNDGLMMGKRYICNVLTYSNGSWSGYWEGPLKRSNPNIGTFTSQNVMFMSAYGVTSRLNVIVGLPYIWTKSDGGHMAGQRGLQDGSLFLKWQPLKAKTKVGTFSAFAVGGISVPLSNYVPDMLPFSIGIRSKTASLRGILNYNLNGFYLTGAAGYTARGPITIDRDAYQAEGRIYDTNKVMPPNVVDASARLGFVNKHLQIEGFVESMTSQSGDDIRRQDAPFPTNKMDMTSAGAMAKVHFFTKSGAFFTVLGQYSQVLSGRNVGQATAYTLGAQHTFRVGGAKN
ncbi:MAG: hypothetical protein LH606_22435 [Cytophagaceae bacterium]|nr:hypothetical protein [Cytophagaceae bacterium]